MLEIPLLGVSVSSGGVILRGLSLGSGCECLSERRGGLDDIRGVGGRG